MGERLCCSKCGKLAACSCGAPYVSKLKYAAAHMDPKKSDRANGKELSVAATTIKRARKQLRQNGAVEAKRKGQDGKTRRLPKKPTGRPRGRPPGKTKAQRMELWAKKEFEKRATPNEIWENGMVEALGAILKLESDREQHDKLRQFTMTPCTYNAAVRVIDVLRELVSQLSPSTQENAHVVRH